MAGNALGIVISGAVIEGLMGIVAGNATDAGIVADETLAEGHAVWLEADECWPVPAIAHDGIKGSMALAAEVGNLFSVEMLE